MPLLHVFKSLLLTVLFLSTFISGTFYANASDLSYLPRISYNTSGNDHKSLIGNYLYAGAAVGKWRGGEGIEAISIKFGLGKTGNKLNISWYTGNSFLSYEAGISYINQKHGTTLLIDSNGSGPALEASLRWTFGIVNIIAAKDLVTTEFGIGF